MAHGASLDRFCGCPRVSACCASCPTLLPHEPYSETGLDYIPAVAQAEFKYTHLEFKRTFRTSDCVASNWLERLDWPLFSFNRVQMILGQEPLDSTQWYKQTGCCISSPGS